jgi:hypothetical protein
MSDFINDLRRKLIWHMSDNNLEPYEDIILDGQPHEYEAYINGEYKSAIYAATLYPLEADPNGPVLIACYGLLDEKEHHSYSSLTSTKQN